MFRYQSGIIDTLMCSAMTYSIREVICKKQLLKGGGAIFMESIGHREHLKLTKKEALRNWCKKKALLKHLKTGHLANGYVHKTKIRSR